MKFIPQSIPGVVLVQPDVWRDDRGFFLETHHGPKYAAGGIPGPFVQDNHSHSARGVLRGLHFQREHAQGKLVYAVRGAIWDVAVDIRRGSPAYGTWVACELSEANRHQLYVPPGCLHGFVVLSEMADVLYKCTDVYHANADTGVIWNDPELAIPWPVSNPSLSPKDARLPRWRDLPESDRPVFAG